MDEEREPPTAMPLLLLFHVRGFWYVTRHDGGSGTIVSVSEKEEKIGCKYSEKEFQHFCQNITLFSSEPYNPYNLFKCSSTTLAKAHRCQHAATVVSVRASRSNTYQYWY